MRVVAAVVLTVALLGVSRTGRAADGVLLQAPQQSSPTPPQLVVPPLVPPLRQAPAPPAPQLVMPQLTPLPLPPPMIVKCGMTIVHGYATIDPKILVGRLQPAPNAPKPSIGVMPAPACQE